MRARKSNYKQGAGDAFIAREVPVECLLACLLSQVTWRSLILPMYVTDRSADYECSWKALQFAEGLQLEGTYDSGKDGTYNAVEGNCHQLRIANADR